MEDQNNTLQEEISQLQVLCKRMEDMNNSRFNPPATEEEISNWECANSIKIPESYKEWLRFSNGSQIFTTTASFFGVKEISISKKYIPEDLVNIGELIGDGELICFLKETGKIIRLFEGKKEELDSFKEILLTVIEIGKSKLGEDESTNKIGAMMLAMLEAKRDSPEGLTDKQAKMLAMLESKKIWRE